MSLIQKAAQRLEELQRAGVAVPPVSPTPSRVVEAVEAATARAPQPAPVVDPSARRSAEVTLDLARLEAEGYLVPQQSRSPLAEEFRHIKQPLLRQVREALRTPGSRGALLMVTSAVPKEGKTFCAINLALSLAMEIDLKVLLVDADVLRPSVLDRLGVEPRRGLLDVLTDPATDLSEVMLRTNVPELTLLPAGTRNARSTELLASDAMERLLVELSSRYHDRVVVFDAPPLLATTEAKVLAARLGQVVMVVEAGNTSRGTVAEAFASIEQCKNVVAVLNKCTEPLSPSRYGYYYG